MPFNSSLPGTTVADLKADWGAVTDVRPFAEAERKSNLIEHGFSPLWRGVVRVLSNLPIIGNTDAVKQAAADITFSDTARAERFDAFVGALRSQYGEAVSHEAIALTSLSPANYLSLSKMREVRDVAQMRESLTHNQQFSNRVEVKVWPWENMSRVGHVALMLRHEKTEGGEITRADGEAETYASWWPGAEEEREGEQVKEGELQEKITSLTRAPRLGVPTTFRENKILELSARAQRGLMSGKFQPKEGQVLLPAEKGEEAQWGMEPEFSIAMPMAGYNERPVAVGTGEKEQTTAPALTTFGLNGPQIKNYWEKDVLGDESAQFALVSADSNCSGMAARLLKAGGAGAFVPVPTAQIFLDPNTMHRYSVELMREVTALNAKADAVDRAIGALPKTVGQEGAAAAPISQAERVTLAQAAIAALHPSARASMQTLSNVLNACQTEAADYEGMMQQMKALVGGLHDHVNGPFGSDINKALRAAYELYDTIRGAAHKASYLHDTMESDIASDFFDD
ncbi:hypothetical protein WM40_18265 [Robbsia andropogonis]|uniref:Uncharacterized protein n=1 Tax=Robbsia andropogonis TaxID=28092 RepID=A0A0F5JXA0_9BURK|nr:hypothetical protein [Robbsia andropogonis]KKB62254.1 hypothetical protein WM40_18265 [Robbsia andropogonis]